MSYRKRILCLTLVVASLEFILCNHILACCSAKRYSKPREIESRLLYGDSNCRCAFKSDYFNIIRRSWGRYIHVLYCSKHKGFFYKFFLQQYTTSRTYYLCWTLFEHVLKKLTGVVWIYKNVGNWEFYYGSVIGLGWYPQCLKFNKFSVGFFDVSINLTSLFMQCCHFFCHRYFHLVHDNFKSKKKTKEMKKKETDESLVDLYTKAIKDTKYSCVFDLCLDIGFFEALFFGGFSFVNIKTKIGIKIKMLQLMQILKFMKFRFCAVFSNIAILANNALHYVDNNVEMLTVIYPDTDVLIYCYNYESHFFFGERDHFFWLLLEIFIPSIEINISALSKRWRHCS